MCSTFGRLPGCSLCLLPSGLCPLVVLAKIARRQSLSQNGSPRHGTILQLVSSASRSPPNYPTVRPAGPCRLSSGHSGSATPASGPALAPGRGAGRQWAGPTRLQHWHARGSVARSSESSGKPSGKTHGPKAKGAFWLGSIESSNGRLFYF